MPESVHGVSTARARSGRDGCSRSAGRLRRVPLHAPAGAGVQPDSRARLLLHLVRHRVLGAGEDDLPAARPLLERRRSDPAPPRRARAGRGAERFHRQLEVDAEAEPAPGRPSSASLPPRDFKLAIIYQGLDFSRNPLPVERVASDLMFFARRFGSAAPFSLEDKPVVIWSGTWKFTTEQVESGREAGAFARAAARLREVRLRLSPARAVRRRRRLLLVVGRPASGRRATPRSCGTCRPRCTTWRGSGSRRLRRASTPADRRHTRRRPPRRNTLRQEWNTALASSPDAVGLISWNEFSESSEIEPTLAFGPKYLHLVKEIIGGRFTVKGDFDSSDTPPKQFGYAVPLFIGVGAVLFTGLAAFVWRRELKKTLGRVA